MSIRKISVSLDERAAAAAEQLARAEGLSLSAWLSRAAMREARIADGLAAVGEWEADHHAPSAADTTAAQAEIDRAAAALATPAVRTEYQSAVKRLYSGENERSSKRHSA